jgi:beta-lactamase class D
MIKKYRLFASPIIVSLLLFTISSSRATYAGDTETSGTKESDAYYWTYFNIPKMSNEERMAFARKMMNNPRQFSAEQMKRVERSPLYSKGTSATG